MRKWPIDPRPHTGFLMEAERINTIANQLVDLSNRVNELRGYL
jgi:hypothetical protein